MDIRDVVSLSLFIIFLVSYSLKLWLLSKKQGIQAHVLGKKGKPDATRIVETGVKFFSAIWGILWFAYSSGSLGGWLKTFSAAGWVSWTGSAITAFGVLIFIIAMLYMKSSWRVGIDKTTQTALVRDGLYRFSRNPAFVGFDLMFIGFMLMYPNTLNIGVGVCNLILFHLLIRQEEKHLNQTFGEVYQKYAVDTPRYLWFI
ncbi:protein-S-isoprenylcysteine O-methyltransferase Ste14 [Fontibacillus phaseoli]|uniref:Protein-S-isoprenylcysteine O-methyltransferase Ste14 n=1 Tax=Fontibacillus phaseoli TaxID=1416533 RepID=A0A369BRE9_9BACL|nr:isoprenylcysteine carboxylmethyltransferase family protein [Fontibacillus phaseoli]RCX23166.1 protein-S-isoprenylcysteine O-methyltransferase Ste14 [Fontibacillus phaseoli]